MDAIMQEPLVVDISDSDSSSLVYIALTDVDRCMSGARSARPFWVTMLKKLVTIDTAIDVTEHGTRRHNGGSEVSDVVQG